MTRLDPGTFDIAVNEIRIGYRSAVYFNRTRHIMREEKPSALVTMQVFQKGKDSILCGMDEVIAILKTCVGHWQDDHLAEDLFKTRQGFKRLMRQSPSTVLRAKIANMDLALNKLWIPTWKDMEVFAAHDGDHLQPWEACLRITGSYAEFAHLESVYLGILARQTKIATNTYRVTSAANGKPVLFFADRFDHYATQGGDGYAAHIGGAAGFASAAMGEWWGSEGTGTMPHALIAAYHGSVPDASEAFHTYFPSKDLIALVDFNNDCVTDSIACLERFGKDLYGVRLDTSENMVDKSISYEDMGDFKPTGVNPQLVRNVRRALNDHGGMHVKIIVSGGFTAEKIAQFEGAKVPVDVYAVGSSLLQGSNDFTADIVYPAAKAGRRFRDTPLERVE